jgi:hypothetical protein
MPRNEATGYLSTVHRLVYIQLPPLLPRNSTLRTACPTSYTLPVRGERATIVFSRPCPIPETRQRGLVPTKYYLQYLKETLLKLKTLSLKIYILFLLFRVFIDNQYKSTLCVNKGNKKITELRAILQRESQNS